MVEPNEDVPVLYKDVEELHRTLTSVYNFLWAHDLIKAYSALRNKPSESMLTQAVRRSRDRLFGYIHEAQQNDVELPSVDSLIEEEE